MPTSEERMTVLEKRDPGPGMTLAERPVPTPGDGEVRIAVESVGIDGGVEAPFHRWEEPYHRYEPHLPQVFGHEFAGVVDAVGPDVEGWTGGERVAVEPRFSCGRCRNCREGEQNLCTERPGFSPHGRRSIGIDVDTPGALAEYVVVPARNLYELPEGVTYDEGVFLELLAIGVHAVDVSPVGVGDRVAVTGPGSAGLSALVAAR
ncbi:zinc-binding dehydrogenase, partial [Halobium palmae]